MKVLILLFVIGLGWCNVLSAQPDAHDVPVTRHIILAPTVSGLIDSGIVMRPDPSGNMWSGQFLVSVSDNQTDPTASEVDTVTDFEVNPMNGASCGLEVTAGLGQIASIEMAPGSVIALTWILFSSNFKSFDSVTYSVHCKSPGSDMIAASVAKVSWVGSSSVAEDHSTTSNYALPNPFTTHTTIGFTIAKPVPVKLQLFDITGRAIRETERECSVGTNEIELDTRDVPPGCYWYILHGGEWERSGKVVKLSPVWTGF